MLASGELVGSIAPKYGVSVRTIYAIASGDRWCGEAVRLRNLKVTPERRNELFAQHVRGDRTQRQLAKDAGLSLGTLAAALKDAAAVIGCQARNALATAQPLPAAVRGLELGEDKIADLASNAPSERELPKRLIREISAA